MNNTTPAQDDHHGGHLWKPPLGAAQPECSTPMACATFSECLRGPLDAASAEREAAAPALPGRYEGEAVTEANGNVRRLLVAGGSVDVRGYASHLGGLYRSESVARSVSGDDGTVYPLVRADEAHGAALDCRTCRHYTENGGCMSVIRCVQGGAHQRAGVIRYWDTEEPSMTAETTPVALGPATELRNPRAEVQGRRCAEPYRVSHERRPDAI